MCIRDRGNAAVIIFFAILHFLPIKFAYPSQATRLKSLTILASAIILLAMPLIVWFYPEVPSWLKWVAIGNLVYFGGLSAIDTFVKKKFD